MIWTCAKCGHESGDVDTKCLGCRADRTAGLSEEERAALDAFNAGRTVAGDPFVSDEEWRGWHATSRKAVVERFRAARAPLEAELTTWKNWAKLTFWFLYPSESNDKRDIAAMDFESVRKVIQDNARDSHNRSVHLEAELTKLRTAIKDLERQRDNHQQASGAAAERAERAEESVRELEARVRQERNGAECWAMMNKEAIERVVKLEAQLAQAQKPAAPAGLPDVGTFVRRKPPFSTVGLTVVEHGFYTAGGVWLRSGDEGVTWERLPPAQMSREPATYYVPRDRAFPFKTSASPPGEVKTENLLTANSEWWHLRSKDRTLAAMLVQVEMDIRSNVEAERAKWEGKCAEVLARSDRAAVERIEKAEKERDAALAEVRDLRAKLEAAEENLGKWKDVAQRQEGGKLRESRIDAEKERHEVAMQRDQLRAEVERLKSAASQPRRCPADGMSTAEVGHALASAGYHNNDGFWDAQSAGSKARELFTPSECAKPQGGNEGQTKGTP